MDIEEIVERFRSSCEVLRGSKFITDKDVKFLIQFREKFDEIAKVASNYDFGNVPANGYRSLLRTFLNVIEHVCSSTLSEKKISNFVELITEFIYYLELLEQSRAIEACTDLNDQQVRSSQGQFYYAVGQRLAKSDIGNLIAHNYLGINYKPSTRRLIKLAAFFGGIVHATGFTNKLKCLTSYKTAIKNFNDFHRYSTPEELHYLVCLGLDSRMVRVFRGLASSTLHSPFRTTIKNISVETKRNWKIIREESQVSINPISSQLTAVKCVSIRTSSNSSDANSRNGKVLMFLPGAGFLGPSAKAFVNVYLREFASKLPGLTVIGVKFPVGPEVVFPEALQAILDFYVWLTSEHDDVMAQLGFHPSEVAIAGDSSAGCLAATLVVAINEVRRKISDLQLTNPIPPLPKSLICLYPATSYASILLPSYLLGFFDLVLRTPTMYKMNNFYAPRLKRDVNSNQWTLDDSEVLERGFCDNHEDLVRSPFLSPDFYEHHDDLKTVNLTMIVLNFCPILDMGLCLTRSWKGPVKFVALDDVFHPFLWMGLVNRDAQKAINLTINAIDESYK